ncbi:MAG: hypothetical protein IK099_07250 [Clostridia bacterium]|nr:hypothetical protein [Clostridia bacterium]
MLGTILTITLILTLVLLALIVYVACIAAGREDQAMEHMYEKWELEHSDKTVLAPAEKEA